MARNGSGVYSKLNTFVAGNTITAAGHNDQWDDLVAEMTNSVAADGQTTLTGALKGYAGSVGAPGYSFASDSNCGFYRIAADNIGASCAGNKVIDISVTGLDVTGTLVTSSTITATGSQITAGTHLVATTIVFAGNGTKTAPSYGFTSDADNGLYLVGANSPGMSAGDTKVQEWVTTGTTVTGTLTATGALSAASVTGSMVAAQADQETATSVATIVTPGRQHFHPSAAKCWLKCDDAGNVNASYNITSITDTGAGVVTVTIATDFSSADYVINLSIKDASSLLAPYCTTQAAGSFVMQVFTTNTGALADPDNYYASCFGDI
jgi:hypothetical protein